MNRYEGIGNLTRDIELKEVTKKDGTKSKTAIMDIAINDNGKTLFLNNVEVWNGLAENACKYLKKGSKVYIEASVENNNYEKDGTKYYGYKFTANKLEFLTPLDKDKE